MRVLVVVSEAPPIVSGISRCIDRLTAGLRSRGHVVDVISAVDVPRVTWGEFRFSSFAAHWRKMARELPRYDVVNLHGPAPTMSDVFLMLSRTLPPTRRPRLVYTHHGAIDIRGLGPACALYNRAHRSLSRAAHRVVVTSNAYHDLMVRADGPPVDVVPWGVDAPSAADASLIARPQGGRLRVLFVGQMRPYKGVDTLLRAVSGQRALDVTIVGAGPLLHEYRRLGARLGADNVRFTGSVSDAELRLHYASHDVIALPSTTRAEAFGLVLLEGMAAGCVPVASDLPGVREVASLAGLVVPPRDHLALREALTSLAADPVRLRQRQERAQREAADLSWDRAVLRYEQVFEKAIARWHDVEASAVLPSVLRQGDAMLTNLVREFDASWGSILMFRRQPSLEVWARWGRAALPQLRDEPPRIASHVVLTQNPRCLDGSGPDESVGHLLRRSDVRSALVVPFEGRHGTVGVVNLARSVDRQRGFTRSDLDRLVEWLPGTVTESHSLVRRASPTPAG